MRSAETAVIFDYLKGKMKYQVVSERQGNRSENYPLCTVPFPTDNAIRPLHAIRRPVAQSQES